MNRYHFISGLPRTGSTMLSAILSQNPNVYAGGNSALCQLMWDAQQSCEASANQQLNATGRFHKVKNNLCSAIPNVYYSELNDKNIFDKCRSWTLKANIDLILNYITDNPKIIVLVRPIEAVVSSFVQLYEKNNQSIDQLALLEDWSEPIMRSYNGVMHAKEMGSQYFLFVDYDKMVSDTQGTLDRIYKFTGVTSFNHCFSNIVPTEPENDAVYGLKNMHTVRETIKKVENKTNLTEEAYIKCKQLTENLYSNLQV